VRRGLIGAAGAGDSVRPRRQSGSAGRPLTSPLGVSVERGPSSCVWSLLAVLLSLDFTWRRLATF